MPVDKVNEQDATNSAVSTGQEDSGDTLRTGSPFAPGSIIDAAVPADTVAPIGSGISADILAVQNPPPEILTDGVMKYTAKGSATASLMVIFFAATAAWLFPAGGVLIAGLGCGLAVGGMFSDYRLPSAGLLVVHLGLFFASYSMAI